MQFALIFVVIIAIQQPPAEKKPSKRDNPKTAIKAVLDEASEIFKTEIKAYLSAKTSADRSNVLDAAATRFDDWIDTIDSIPVTFESRVLDVIRHKTSDSYYVVLEQGKDLRKFIAQSSAPTSAARKFHIEVTEDQSKTIKIGSQLTITGNLSTTLSCWVNNQGDSQSNEFDFGTRQPLSLDIACLFTFNYSNEVFSKQAYDFFQQPKRYITFVLEDAAIQFPDKKP